MLLAATLLAPSAGAVHAQLDFGLNVGPSLSDITGSYIESSKTTSGIYIGAILEWEVSPRWAIESGITSQQKGAFHVRLADDPGEWDFRTSYIQIPLRVRYMIRFAEEKWVFGPYAGVGFSVSGSCKVRETGFPIFDDECSETTAGGEMSKTDLMYGLGFVIDRVFSQSGFGLDVRYARGTGNIFAAGEAQGLTAKNSTIDIKIRLIFPGFGNW
jgi:hypothetical protein